MKLSKIYQKAKEYLEKDKEEDIKKKKIKELEEKIQDKISKLKKKAKDSNCEEETQTLKSEIGVLKGILEKIKTKY